MLYYQTSGHLSSAAHLLLGDGWRMWTRQGLKKKDSPLVTQARKEVAKEYRYRGRKKVG